MSCSLPSASSPAGCSRTYASTPSSSGASARLGQAEPRTFTRRCSTSTNVRTWSGATASGTSDPPRLRRWRSSPRRRTATSTSDWPTSSHMFAEKAGIDVYQVIEASNSQPYSHIHQPGHLRRRALHPRLPAPLPLQRPGRHGRARGTGSQRVHARGTQSSLLEAAYGDLAGSARGGARARPIAAGSRKRHSPAFSTPSRLSEGSGSRATVHDPLYIGEELHALGLLPHVLTGER